MRNHQSAATDPAPWHKHDEDAPRVSIIIPTLNEEPNVDLIIAQTLDAFRESNLDCEILIADGGSTDDTRNRARRWRTKAPVRLIEAESGKGLAGDVLAAARCAATDIIVVMDADLSHPPDVAPILANKIASEGYDMAIGSRYVRGGATPGWPRSRRLMSRAASLLTWPLVNVKDPMSGFFAIAKDKLLRVDENACGFKIGLEALLVSGDTLKTCEVPIRFVDRCEGDSKMSSGQANAFLKRTTELVGGALSTTSAARFAVVGLIGLLLDLTIFNLLRINGASIAFAHISSFVLAAASNFYLNKNWTFRDSEQTDASLTTWLKFIAVALIALVLRGGVIGALVTTAHWNPNLAVIAAIGVAAFVNYLGNAFYVFPAGRKADVSVRWRLAALAVIAFSVALRIAYAGAVDLAPEEAYYWTYAQHPAMGYLDHPPMVAWLIWTGAELFGDTEIGVRLGTLLCWFISLAAIFGLARNMFGKSAGFLAAMLMAILPFFIVWGFVATPDAPLTAAWAGALFFLERALVAEKRIAWWGVGVCIGLGMLSKYTIALLGPAILLYIIIDPRSRKWLLRPEPWLAAFTALVIFSPVIIWNYENNWASFAFQSTRRISKSPEFSLHLLVGSIIVLMTPLAALGALRSVAIRRLWTIRSTPVETLLTRQRLFSAIFALVPLSVFVLFSLTHQPKLNWTGPLWLALLPVLANDIIPPADVALSKVERFGQRLWKPTIVTLMIGFGAFLHYLSLGLPGVGYSDNMLLPVAWQEFGAEVEMIEEDLEHIYHIEPLVVGMDRYFVAAELAFYRRAGSEAVTDTTSQHLFGAEGIMFETWHPTRNQQDRLLILVALDPNDLRDQRLQGWVQSYGPLHERQLYKQERNVGTYYYRVAFGYDPQAQANTTTFSTFLPEDQQPAAVIAGAVHEGDTRHN